MRYININSLIDIMGTTNFENWLNNAGLHFEKIKGMNKKERAKYFTKHSIWNDLYKYLSQLSKHKCWYSEAPENSSEWSIDHYRPKNESKDLDGKTIRDDGYWWLAFEWKNFRLSGSLINLLRKDRFKEDDLVYGKLSFFPLDLENGFTAEPFDIECGCEIPLLLDPLIPRDVTLISFDKNGEVYETFNESDDPWKFLRAKESIKYYGLDHTPLNRGRSKIWEKCTGIVETTLQQLQLLPSNPFNRIAREKCIDKCYYELAVLSSDREPYSMVVYSFVLELTKNPDYFWLRDVVKVLQ